MEKPFSVFILALGKGRPSLNQVIAGLGSPDASQLRFADWPAEMFNWRRGCAVKCGAHGSFKSAKFHDRLKLVKQMFQTKI